MSGPDVVQTPAPDAPEGFGPAILTAQNVSKRFGGLAAVSDVSFEIPERSIVSIIGPNGAGKTTFFNMLTGLYRPTSGAIRFQGKDITEKRPDRITTLGVARTFQNIRLFGTMTAIGLFLITYPGHSPEKGEHLSDDFITTVAGIAAFGVAYFPNETRMHANLLGSITQQMVFAQSGDGADGADAVAAAGGKCRQTRRGALPKRGRHPHLDPAARLHGGDQGDQQRAGRGRGTRQWPGAGQRARSTEPVARLARAISECAEEWRLPGAHRGAGLTQGEVAHELEGPDR